MVVLLKGALDMLFCHTGLRQPAQQFRRVACTSQGAYAMKPPVFKKETETHVKSKKAFNFNEDYLYGCTYMTRDVR
jgi:hypothetical protein